MNVDRWPIQASSWLEWSNTSGKSALRFQHSKLPTACGKVPLHSSESGQGRIVPSPRGLGGAVFATTQLAGRSCSDRVGLDSAKARTGDRETLSGCGTPRVNLASH